MSDQDKKNQAADFFLEYIEQFGVAVSKVTDGFVLGFKRAHMQKIIDEHPDNEMLVILVQDAPTVKNPSSGN